MWSADGDQMMVSSPLRTLDAINLDLGDFSVGRKRSHAHFAVSVQADTVHSTRLHVDKILKNYQTLAASKTFK